METMQMILYYAVILVGVGRLTYGLFQIVDRIERPRKRARR